MAVRKLLPTTPGQRNKIISKFDTITKSEPEKRWFMENIKPEEEYLNDHALYWRHHKRNSELSILPELKMVFRPGQSY